MEGQYNAISSDSMEIILVALRERERQLADIKINGLTDSIRTAAVEDHQKTIKAWGELENLLQSFTVIGVPKRVIDANVFVPKTLAEIERKAIVDALQLFKGYRTAVAESLGISERTIYRKIREYNIEL